MDIVIPLGKGSKCNDFELLYCLRSIEKHLSHWDCIYIIGENPAWIKHTDRVVFIPFEETEPAHNREINILQKILAACQNANISNDFLLMNDDHFILGPCSGVEHSIRSTGNIPYQFQETLQQTMDNRGRQDEYWFVLKNTCNFLSANNLPSNHFDIHSPVIYNKGKFKVMFADLPANLPTFGYAIKSLYCNYWCLPGEPYADCKIKVPVKERATITEIIKGRWVFSVGDAALNSEMFQVLQELYPTPSTFEGHR